ncbi:flagellar filament capping protein FliD [Paenibacillus sp. Marseille-Q9583]
MVARINGFSGMDIDSMVKSMMAAKRVPLDKLLQDKQLLEWKRDSYREINSKLYEFKNNKLTDKYGFNSALNANKAIISGNTDALKAEATADANGTDMKVSIERLATKATLETKGVGSGKSGATTLAILAAERAAASDGKVFSDLSPSDKDTYLKANLDKEFDLVINGINFRDGNGKPLFNGKTSISTMVATINANSDANVAASFDEVTGKLLISSKISGASGKVELGVISGGNPLIDLFGGASPLPSRRTVIETNSAGANLNNSTKLGQLTGGDLSGTYSFSIEGVTLSFNGSETIGEVVKKISDTGKFTASFDSSQGKLIFTSKTNESDGKIELGAAADNTLLTLFKGTQQTYTSGVNAQVTINGTKLERDTNNFTINGVALTLLATTAADKTVTITTQTDSTKAVETIKGFIQDYNELLKLLNNKTSEAKYRTFTPLTDEQKKDMKEADIKAWTEKAQSGLLKNDDILKSMVSSMRMAITGSLGDLNAIGITTGKYYEGGKLYLNESKLKQAISDNPQKIIDLLQGPASDTSAGLFDKLATKAGDALERFSEKAGTNKFSADLTATYKEESVMGRTLNGYKSRIATLQKNLTNAENRYYKQFSAMETAMNKLNAQSANLLSSMGYKN